MVGYYGITLAVHVSVSLSYVSLYVCSWMIARANVNGFSTDLVYSLILWRSGFGLLMGKFRQFLTELSAHNTPIFSFLDDNLSKNEWMFTKLCIDIVDI